MRVQPVVVNVPLFERTAHLCDVLGDDTYESLARAGATMTTATMDAHPWPLEGLQGDETGRGIEYYAELPSSRMPLMAANRSS